MKLQELASELNIQRFVVWGLRTVYNDSHHFIHRGFFVTLKKLGANVIWIDDSIDNSVLIDPGDFVIAVNRAMQHLPYIPGCKYCLHNARFSDEQNVNPSDIIYLQVLTKDRIDSSLKNTCQANSLLEGAAYFNKADRIIYQSWGTPLLVSEFLKPKKLSYRKYEFFVGAIWNNDKGQGNDKVIPQYAKILKENAIQFVHVQGAPEVFNPSFVRHSAVGASIVGEWQQHWGYAPCRLFKAVSYGIPGLINSSALLEPYPWVRADEDIARLVSFSLELKSCDARDLVAYQQSFIAKETYESKLKNLLICLNAISS